jgi:hypothetical protein
MPRIRDVIPARIRHAAPDLANAALRPAFAIRSQRRTLRGLHFGQRMTASSGVDCASLQSSPGTQPNRLEEYFDNHTVGPGIWKWRHYFEIYHRHFAKFVGREVNIVEIGVFSGGSLGMWLDYFGSGCRVYGVDIEPSCTAYETDSIRIFIGDQASPAFWENFLGEVSKIDIVVDDGGHLTNQQITTFESIFAHIDYGGVYLCEDIHGVSNGFHDYVCGLSRNINEWGPTAFQKMIHSIHLYPFVTVVERPSVPLSELTAPKHGTLWQPFL